MIISRRIVFSIMFDIRVGYPLFLSFENMEVRVLQTYERKTFQHRYKHSQGCFIVGYYILENPEETSVLRKHTFKKVFLMLFSMMYILKLVSQVRL